MSAKIITYDLRKVGQDYKSLIDEIKKYSNCVKITESCWAITSDNSSEIIAKNLISYIDSNDRLFVGELTKDAAWLNVIGGTESLRTTLA